MSGFIQAVARTLTFSNHREPVPYIEHQLTKLFKSSQEQWSQNLLAFELTCPQLFNYFCISKNQIRTEISDDFYCSKIAIENLLLSLFVSLSETNKNELYGIIYELVRPQTTDPKWGERHAFDDIPTLIQALDKMHLLEGNHLKILSLHRNEAHLADHSCFYELEGRESLPGRSIGYINGIGTVFNIARSDAARLSDNVCNGHQIEGIWNATHGFVEDLIISAKLMIGYKPEPTRLLLSRWTAFFNRYPTEHYLQICFSQGALMVENIIKELPEALRRRIDIIAIAPASFLKPEDGYNVFHFVKLSDSVPVKLASNNQRLKTPSRDIIILEDDASDPHDPHGANYVRAIRPFIERYLERGHF